MSPNGGDLIDEEGEIMKRVLGAAFLAACLAGPALAGANVVKFEPVGEEPVTMTFKDDGTFTMGEEVAGTYTWDEEAKTLCGTVEGEEICATFEEVGQEVGFSTSYTTSTGGSGTATLIEVMTDKADKAEAAE